MSVKLDVKDKKILYELSKNCRIPSVRLARTVSVSREVVDYRIKQLLSRGVITCFVADIDISKLGCTRYLIYLELQKVSESEESEILKKIVSNPFVSWTTTQTGKWNVIFDVIAKNANDVDHIIKGLKEKHSQKISDYKIATQLEYRHYFCKYFSDDREERKTTECKPDKTDLKLLKAITKDARANYISISDKLGINANTVKLRMHRLYDAGIIRQFTIEVNKEALGLQAFNIQLTFKDTAPEKMAQFLRYVKRHQSVNFYYFPLGHWDLEIGVFVKEVNELRRIILEFRNKFSDVVRIYDCMIFYEELKPNYVPEGVFE